MSDELLRLTAERSADDGLRLQAHHSAWTTCLFAGEPAEAREHCEAGRRLYDPERHRSHRLLYGGHDPGVCAGNIGAQAEWLLGYPEKALGASAAKHWHWPSGSLTRSASRSPCFINAMLHLNRGEPELALQRLEAAEALAAEQRLCVHATNRGCCAARL